MITFPFVSVMNNADATIFLNIGSLRGFLRVGFILHWKMSALGNRRQLNEDPLELRKVLHEWPKYVKPEALETVDLYCM